VSVNNIVPEKIVAITASDATDVTGIRAVRVGTAAGTVVVRNEDGTTVTVPGVQVGETLLTGRIDRVMAATTATGLNGYYCQ
jgi:hypothetical protein